MQTSFLLFFVSYFLVVFVALLGFFWNDARFFWLALINLLSLVIFFVVSFVLKKKEGELKKVSEELKSEKIRYPHQFVKYPKMKNEKKGKIVLGYLLFVSIFLFLFSVLDLIVFKLLGQYVRVFPMLYLLLLLILGKDLIENKIKIFGFVFDFYFFLFISSIIVGVLVYGTLISDVLPILLLAGLVVSFLFFFVGYIFIKSQGFRYFFRLIYARLYFVAILVILVRSFIIIPPKNTFGESMSKLSNQVSTFFETIFEKKNKDPLLYTGEGQVISSGFIETNIEEDDIFEETGEVVSEINSVFVADEEIDVVTGSLDKDDSIEIIKEELGINNTDTVSMIDSLRFLMETNKITLSTNTNTNLTYVSKTNPLYAYWKTAYDKSMIGAKTNPSTKITCEIYQVFKGMLLNRDLKYTSVNVKKVFWDEATKLDVLNGCEYGKLLKGENL
ncbi:MAG: hypothetical protein PHR61_05230 [Candidatus Absconditabacteria bacterium]|nr:hypothetical protein [Candidatus Absconditabacteria bacterium]